MNEQKVKKAIEAALQTFSNQPLAEAALHLLEVLGYSSQRRFKLCPNNLDTFLATFDQGNTFNGQYALPGEWQSIDFLYQLTDDEIRAAGHQQFLLESQGAYNGAIINSFLFFALELKAKHYTRTALARITRELNKLFDKPVLVLFRHGETLTLAVINRRPHKRDEGKYVLEKVSLIHDIRCNNTHRAHIEILYDLSLDALRAKHDFSNFVELQSAWQETLDTSALNKRFYQELANWYFWALPQARFPQHAPKDADGRDSLSLIRLITRVIFCWFLKEKGLLPDALFDPGKVATLLNDVSPQESTYYKAILQNLFFATLNQEMGKREFRKNGQHFMAHNLYRYRRLLKNPDAVLKLFASIPFMNGGLFECLDKTLGTREKPEYVRIDGFSDRDDNPLKIPNDLFFNTGREVDLSAAYGAARYRKAKVCGLIHILDRYKFTVAENTPIEEEIALDPELLGKVFENLLAAYNPETGATARKQTGSFYTPREIVNYMVDESLLARLKTKLEAACPSAENNEERLRHLFAYNAQPHQFAPAEVNSLIDAIDHLKILDPACGSGAFPMGVLHKLVFVLSKLDPGNHRWKARQLAKAAEIPDATLRERVLDDIEQTFGANELDYGRKLYLIENCIYGVDIQPIAVQIAKLRCFISLVVDQKINPQAENLGIRSLPNLETRFVAANTLIELDRPVQQPIRDLVIEAKEDELRRVRERYFLARTPATKARYREQDANLRAEIAELLKNDGWDTATARKLASWDPYDQNASAEFFDIEWMFGRLTGFDLVIANPPYGANIDAVLNSLRPRYKKVIQNYADSFKMFFQVGLELTATKGILTYITPNVFLSQPRYKDLRKYLLHYKIRHLVNLGENVFEQIVPVCLSFISNESAASSYQFADLADSNKFNGDFSTIQFTEVSTARVTAFKDLSLYSGEVLSADQVYFFEALEIKDAGIQYHRSGIGLKNKGGNDLYERLFSVSSRQFPHTQPVWYGRLIDRYWIQDRTDEFFNLDYDSILKETESVSFTRAAFSVSPKILWRQTASRLRATIDYEGRWFRNTIQCAYPKKEYESRVDIHYLLGVINSSYIAFAYNKLVREAGRVFPQVKITQVKKLPLAIPPKLKQHEIAMKVKAIIEAKRKNANADTSILEREIDRIVYALYGLTPDEIRLVEEAGPLSSRRAASAPDSPHCS